MSKLVRVVGLVHFVFFAACESCSGDKLGSPILDPSDAGTRPPTSVAVIPRSDCAIVRAIVRDFDVSHPDFEDFLHDVPTPGLVEPELGEDGRPVLASVGEPQQITSAETFAEWYRDVPGVNHSFTLDLLFRETMPGSGTYVFEASRFFPVDGLGFGDSGRSADGESHNFHFTTEIHTSFVYRGGEVFSFRGDDDLWIFVNERLALDLGGMHESAGGTIDFDARAEELGIEIGGTYPMDVFHAERHTVASTFHMQTNIDCFVEVDPL